MRSIWLRLESFGRGRRRMLATVTAAGVAGGLTGAAFVGTLHVVQRGLWPDRWDLLPHGILLVAVGIAVAVLTRTLGHPGDVELLVDNIHVLGGAKDTRALRSLLPISLLCVGVGGGLGPEAPLVQTTGTLGTWLARRAQLDRVDTRIITITGMAAGFTVLFGAPLGAAVFALEILHRRGLEYYEALLPAVIGSLCGYVVYAAITGVGLAPVWDFPEPLPIGTIDLAWAAGCGIAGAVLAVTFTRLNRALRSVVRRLPSWVAPPLGGLALAGLAAASPYALTFGEAQLEHITTHHLAVRTLLLAAVCKLVASAVTASTGWRGGFIIPLFFVGACLGQAAFAVFPGANEAVLVAGLMVAINVGVTKTPLGSVLVVTEMAGLQLLPTTLVAAMVALVLTANTGMIDTQRRRSHVGVAADG